MDGLMIPVTQLGTKLGRTFAENSEDFARAELAIWQVSVRARSIAEQQWTNVAEVPDAVKAVVLDASYRVFKNPNRYVQNQGGSFQAMLSQSEFKGDIFLQAERDELEKHKPNSGMWTQPFTRADGETFTGWAYDGNGGDPILYGDYPGWR